MKTIPYKFKNNLDACHIKNTIENASNISVSIIKKTDNYNEIYYNIVVEQSNYNKALILLDREIAIINYFKRKEHIKNNNDDDTPSYSHALVTNTIKSTENIIALYYLKFLNWLDSPL
ncbi:hypothetical protein QVZ41_07620 [Wenyingzhuangia sp. chi5]|uniref:Uncharacterized protein n=1 Tax=Wenyingzhuangia gilva TaxID=3057677 RepID=A0ABT8VRW5_9FLAO|nr:hypothetical protein [Wenyingzhuangia sp. chi5]MDO3694709.1 hypothetical protein [Wenyingzhuangia sp. chi5]